jgi:hypothetical protein
LISSRPIQPGENNWKLFAAEIEVLLGKVGAKRDDARLFEALKKHRDWYVGDGMYGDGPEFHWDYYNSFVIQPMMLDITRVLSEKKNGYSYHVSKSFEQGTTVCSSAGKIDLT